MLTEDAVINLLCEHLAADGWKIVSRAMPNQRGTDVVATRAGVRLEVEAKGANTRDLRHAGLHEAVIWDFALVWRRRGTPGRRLGV